MLSLRLSNNVLHIKFETYMGSNELKIVTDFLRNLRGSRYNGDTYTWLVPKEHIDAIASNFEEKIAWHSSIEEIKGISNVVIPKFTVSTEGLDDLKLAPYPFQAIGISFLHDIKQALLADEMGLGKTPTAIGAAHRLWKKGKARKVLVICPSSLKYQWAQEIEKFTYHTSVVIDGNPKDRKIQLDSFVKDEENLFAIINYELVRNDIDYIKEYRFDIIIVDEIHRIKEWSTKLSQAMKQLDAPYKFGLTGTPVQNRAEELFNIMDFLNPTVLGNHWAFRNRYIVSGEKFGKKNVPIGYKHLGELRNRVSQHMLRRMKKEVAPELPEMIINDYLVDMTLEQQMLEDVLREDLQNLLTEIRDWYQSRPMNSNQEEQATHPKEGQSLGYFTMMIGVNNTPELLLMSDSEMAKGYAKLLDGKKVKSPKLDELEEIVREQLAMGNTKMVIFTQFARMQELVVKRLSKIGKVEILNGSMKPFERQASVDRFKYKEDVNFFVTTDAGNYGINLQFANVLIHMDLPWNPAIYDQRCGRIHRIGSSFKEVTIINLITRGGIDERIQEVLYKKRQLANQLVEKNDQEKAEMGRLTSGLMNQLIKPKRGKKNAKD